MKPLSAPWQIYTDKLRSRGKSSKMIEYSITFTCGLGNMLFGYDQGVFGGILTSAPFESTFPSISNGNATLQGFTVAVYETGCAIGAFSVIIWGDRFGRRPTIMMGEFILMIGAVLQFSSYSLAQLIVGRVITGVGNGMAAAVLPTWNGECARDGNRGRAICWQLNINIFGIALSYWVDYALNASSATTSSDWAWRFPQSLQVLFATATIVCASFLPDSPRSLLKRGMPEKARDVLDMLSLEKDPKIRDIETTKALNEIDINLREEEAEATGWGDVFTQGRSRFAQRLTLATFSMCILQLSGINLITYYAPVLFEDTIGMSRELSLLMSGFLGLEFWFATFIPIPLVDRVGRRPLLLIGAAGQCVSMVMLAAMIAYPGDKIKGYVAVVFLFVFDTFCAIGFDCLAFLLPIELTPLRTRAKSVSIATGCFWLCNFFVVMISPVLVQNIQYGTYILWAGLNLSFIPIIYFFIPETSNCSLEDIDVLFESSTSWIMGPGSKHRVADIVKHRKEREATMQVESTVRDETVDMENLSRQRVKGDIDYVENAGGMRV